MIIGLFTTTEDPIIWLTVKGSMQAARSLGASVVIYGGATKKGFSEMDGATVLRHFCFDRSKHAGIIAAFAERPLQEYAQELWDSGYPAMLIARQHRDVPHATTNNQEAICAAVREFADKGHRQIAFLMGPEGNFSALERLAGYRQGLQESGLEFDPQLIIPGDYTEKSAHANLKAALARGVGFSALVAANDTSAIGAMTALREHGLAPGADVEIIGFDNIARGHWTKPTLSSFDPQLYRTGYQACEELVKCIRKEPFEAQIRIPAHFVPRTSTWEARTEYAIDRPLMGEWISHRFHYDTEFEALKTSERVAALIVELQASIETPESFLQCFRELLDEVAQRSFSALCLTPLLLVMEEEARTEGRGSHRSVLLDKIHGLLVTAVFDEQREKTELAHNYTACTTQLRELSFSVAKETQVLSVFRNTLASLGVPYAGIYLYDQPAKPSERLHPEGKWHGWALDNDTTGEAPAPLAARAFEIEWVEAFKPGACWLYLPLLYGDELFGMVVLEADTEYITSYSDLIRLFSFALSSARLNAALARANAELVETSRMAGLAEMATGILHNIGNALNSVNTSCSVAADAVRKSKVPSVAKAAQLLTDQGANIGRFIETDPRGQKLPSFLTQLGEHLQGEQTQMLRELDELRQKIDHINQIVADQQSYAQFSGLVESIQPEELLEFSLKLSEASLTRHKVHTERHFAAVPPVKVQRQKVVQILVNLIRNAKESMGAAHREDKVMILSISSPSPDRVVLSIKDNGKGIAPENLSRIFSFGFTTKPGGHGFGLHNSALAAKEMKGSLSAQSEGLDHGATFILELPVS